MRVFRDLNNLPAFNNAVVTIGSFDGVHHGHQTILNKVNELAKEVNGESIVVTFHPHPRQVIYPKDDSLKLLSSIEEKIELLSKYGVQNVVVVPFTIEFSQMSADEYIEDFLLAKFHPSYIVIGYDHKFGLNRQGDLNYLRWYSKNAAYEVVEIEKQTIDNLAISSTKIRKAIEEKEIKKAVKWLGHYYPLSGKVIQGQKIGSGLGFPTANLQIKESAKLVPPFGIYAAFVYYEKKRYQAMLYIGQRPTFKEHPETTIEVNIFDFDENIYGQELMLELVDFIRDDREFSGIEGLKEQLMDDKLKSIEILNRAQEEFIELTEDKKSSVGIVILNYNGKEHLKRFLPSVLGTAYPNLSLWVADNASTDDSVAFLKNYYPNVHLIELDKNYGFAEGYNQALETIKDKVDYYVLLNSDVEVTPDWLLPIIDILDHQKDVAAVQPKIQSYYKKGEFEYAGAAGGWMDSLGYPFCRGRILSTTEKDEGQYDGNAEIFWASGAAMVVRAKLYHNMGGLDGDYFAHMEEIDLCWRFKRAGFRIMVCTESVVYHVGGGTLSYNTPRKTFLNFRNSLYTLFKNENKWKLLWHIPARLVLDGLAAGLFLTEGKFSHISSILRAHFAFYASFFKLLKKRKRIKRLVVQNQIKDGANQTAILPGTIIWKYYVGRKKTFKEIVPV
ncbi:MAG: bifunctional riboflavin kinase/FAD synthetase [Saprospiraceae bacterium]